MDQPVPEPRSARRRSGLFLRLHARHDPPAHRRTDVLIYSNLDTNAGEMPAQVGASTSKGREKISVWASFDGGHTWPIKRLVYDGPSASSNLGVGRTGTPSQGKIYLIFEGGPAGCYEAVHVVSFNLS